MKIADLTFELGDRVVYQLTILNAVLKELGLPPVSESPDFEIHESSGTFGLDMSVVRSGRNTVPINLYLESGGLRIDVDHIPEAFEWSTQAMEDSSEVRSFIKQLLTSYVLMETTAPTRLCAYLIKMANRCSKRR